jgi:2-amino-4-hydroxy-6-hydroxymethyldihydropteridine diphosphokinase
VKHNPVTDATVYLSLGTNLGQRRRNLERALDGLGEVMAITAVSPIYQTPPWGLTDQPDFLNLCLAATTDLTPRQLLHFNQQLEKRIGRTKEVRWGPRLIDIDILFYDDIISCSEELTIPHPQIAQRAFVLVPLADIAPDLVHPQTGQTVTEMVAQVDTSGVVAIRLQKSWRLL